MSLIRGFPIIAPVTTGIVAESLLGPQGDTLQNTFAGFWSFSGGILVAAANGVRASGAYEILGSASNGLFIDAVGGQSLTAIMLRNNMTAASTSTNFVMDTNGVNRSAGNLLAIQNNSAQVFKVDWAGRVFYKVPNSAPTDADIGTSQITWYLNEAGNTLNCRIRYSDGTTLKSFTTPLALT